MASTKSGDRVEELQQATLERFITGATAHYQLMMRAYMNYGSPQVSDDVLKKVTDTFTKLNLTGGGLMARCSQTLTYLQTGQKGLAPKQTAVSLDSVTSTIKAVFGVEPYKKITAFGGALPPSELVKSENLAGQSVAFRNAEQARSVSMNIPVRVDENGSFVNAYGAYTDEDGNMLMGREAKARRTLVRYARIAESGACDFCRMLEARGPVYYADTRAFQSHGNCKCSNTPADDNWSLPPKAAESQKRWMDKNSASYLRAKKAGNEELVKYGYQKKKTITTKNYRSVSQPDGTTKRVEDGVKSRTVYETTQKGRQVENAIKYSETRAYQKIMNPGRKPLAHSSITAETAEQELSRLHYDLGMVDDDGKLLGNVTNGKEYETWAKSVGVWDEDLLKQADRNHTDHVEAWENLNRTKDIDRSLKRVERAAPRIERIAKFDLKGEIRSLDWWKKRTRITDTDELYLTLRKAGVVVTGGYKDARIAEIEKRLASIAS